MEIAAVITDQEFEKLSTRIDWDSLRGKKILISGATGMVGSWLTTAILLGIQKGLVSQVQIDALVHSGNVTNLRALRSHKALNLVTQQDLLEEAKLNYNLIIHAASPASPQFFRDKKTLFDINVNFLETILSKNSFKAEVIYFSTGEIYGAGHLKPVSESARGFIDLNLERSMYPLAKLEGEKYVIETGEEYSYQYNIFRLFHTFGPGMRIGDGRSFADFIWDGALKKKPRLYSTGDQVRSFLYLEDMVSAVLGLERSNLVINLGSELPVTIKNFAELVSEESGLGGDLEYVEQKNNFKPSPNDLLLPDISLLKSKGWTQEVGLREAIARSITWARR